MKSKANIKNNKILIVGPKPPPYHGVSLATDLLFSDEIKYKFKVYHVDLADRRGIEHVDKPDLYDVFLFIRQLYDLVKIIFFIKPSIGYLPISQRNIGFIRDSIFIWVMSVGGCKIILHLHGGNFRNWYEEKQKYFGYYINFILKKISAMVVLSEDFKILFKNLLPPKKIYVVPNGIKFQSQKIDKIRNHESERKEIVILYLGTLNSLKGVLVLIKSIPLVIKEEKNVRFIFAGPWSDENDKKQSEKYISKHNLKEFVKFTGMISGAAKWEILEASDIFVFPGIQQEGQPLVVLEAMAAGLPIIYTDKGCLQETVPNNVNGLMIKSNNPEDIAQKILILARNPKIIREMGHRNRFKYKNEYTERNYINNMMRIFTHLSCY